MSFDGTTIHCLVHELDQALTGQRINKIAQPEPNEIILTIKTAQGTRRLLISANASLPLIYLTDENKTSPATAPNFCMLLRKHIQGGRITSVSQVGYERVIRFQIEHLDEMGDPASKYLYVEIMGKYSNIIFTDADHVIIDAIKRVPYSVSSVREVLPGRNYFIPAQEGRQNPLTVSDETFVNEVFSKPTNLTRAIYTSFTGFSPVIANEILYRCGLDGNMSTSSCDEVQKMQVCGTFRRLMDDMNAGKSDPCIVVDPDNRAPIEFAAVHLTSYPDMDVISDPSMSSILRRYYASRNQHTNMRQKSSDLRHLITTLLDRNRKKLAIQQKQLKDTGKMDKYRIWGELLHTYGYQAKPKDKSITCINYYDNSEITIPLDPSLTAMDNAAKYFARYDKLKRTKAAVTVNIDETCKAIQHLESMLMALDLAEDEADLSAVHEELADGGYIQHHRGKKQAKMKKSQPLHYVTDDGYDIYVGKNNAQNDELTFHMAHGNDWWFHAKKLHGSHVIVVTDTGELPDHVFEIAAGLAAYYSQGRESDRVEVDYLQKKDVKKPSGAVPGFVVYYTNFSMVAHPSLEGVTLVK